MAESEKNRPAGSVPLGRIFRMKQLPGMLGKSMIVPPGRMGVVIHPKGKVRTFGAGMHKVLSAFDRLRGMGSGLRAGYVPSGEQSAPIPLQYVLSGDGDLLEGSLVCAFMVTDPGRFFNEVVVPNGEIWGHEWTLDPEPIKAAIGAFTRDYGSADLVHGSVTGRLISLVHPGIDAALGSLGLGLRDITLLTLSKAEDRALISEKALEIEERLKNVELQAAMAEIETQEQLLEFIEQLSPGLKRVVAFQLGQNGGKGTSAARAGMIIGALKSWAGTQDAKPGKRRWWRLQALAGKEPQPDGSLKWPTVKHKPRNWWMPRALWMAVALALGWALTALVRTNLQDASSEARLGLYITIWTFELGVIFESLRVLYQKSETLSETTWPLSGHQHLDRLVGHDRRKADELVRRECIRELMHIKEIISEVRTQEHKRGQMDLALKLRNTVERNIENCAAQISDPGFGTPAYLRDMHISQDAWRNMLDTDEELLLFSQALSDRAHLMQKQSHANAPIDKTVADLDAAVLELSNRFHERGRALQTFG